MTVKLERGHVILTCPYCRPAVRVTTQREIRHPEVVTVICPNCEVSFSQTVTADDMASGPTLRSPFRWPR